MKIAILGAGNVGGALGQSWASSGHEIIFGVPRPSEAKTQNTVTSIGAKAFGLIRTAWGVSIRFHTSRSHRMREHVYIKAPPGYPSVPSVQTR